LFTATQRFGVGVGFTASCVGFGVGLAVGLGVGVGVAVGACVGVSVDTVVAICATLWVGVGVAAMGATDELALAI